MMYNHHILHLQPEGSVLATLRQLVPKRPLDFEESRQIAELQAIRLRELFQITGDEFPDEAIMEMPRITVAFDVDSPVSGSVHWSGDAWIIVLNSSENYVRQRFSMAHEFKHILDHTTRQYLYSGSLCLSAAEQAEQAADYFAGCLLMPTMHLKRLFYQGVQTPVELGERFNVSPRAARFRLRQTGITENVQKCDNHYRDRGNVRYNRRVLAEANT
ncbi:MAG TPA: ImmA/IrrE family metallo-endopeptidase [Patescibacteria group bacterium]|nr:ImmA/IrrE family metallo-endopeptidase [Patescibacteria group bacterium]